MRKCGYEIKERTVYDNFVVQKGLYYFLLRVIRFHLPHRIHLYRHSFSGNGSIKKAEHYPNL